MENKKDKKPNVSVIVGISCAVLAVAQTLCAYFSLSLPISLAVDIISVILSALVMLKVLSSDENLSMEDMTKSIREDMTKTIAGMNEKKSELSTTQDKIVSIQEGGQSFSKEENNDKKY